MQNNIERYIALLRNAKGFVSQEVLVTMYNSLVLPYFNYCSTIWHDNNSSQINNLYKKWGIKVGKNRA